MARNYAVIVNGYRRSVVADNCNLYDLEQALYFVNAVSEVPYTIKNLLKSAYDNGHPRILCKVVDDVGLIHGRTEYERDSRGLVAHTIQETIECFTGFFRLHESSGGGEFLKGLAYYDRPTTGISSIVKEFSNGDTLDLAIADTGDCWVANTILQQQWEESKYGYGEPEYIPIGEYFPALPTLYIDEADLELFISVFIKPSLSKPKQKEREPDEPVTEKEKPKEAQRYRESGVFARALVAHFLSNYDEPLSYAFIKQKLPVSLESYGEVCCSDGKFECASVSASRTTIDKYISEAK